MNNSTIVGQPISHLQIKRGRTRRSSPRPARSATATARCRCSNIQPIGPARPGNRRSSRCVASAPGSEPGRLPAFPGWHARLGSWEWDRLGRGTLPCPAGSWASAPRARDGVPARDRESPSSVRPTTVSERSPQRSECARSPQLVYTAADCLLQRRVSANCPGKPDPAGHAVRRRAHPAIPAPGAASLGSGSRAACARRNIAPASIAAQTRGRRSAGGICDSRDCSSSQGAGLAQDVDEAEACPQRDRSV